METELAQALIHDTNTLWFQQALGLHSLRIDIAYELT